jgi:class 3 adenylate cyclase
VKGAHGRDQEARGNSRGGRRRIQQANSADEERTLARLRALRSDLIDPTIAVHHGSVVKRTGDGMIIEFRSVVCSGLAQGRTAGRMNARRSQAANS